MKTFVLEHKTASEDIGVGSLYWQKLMLDAQISDYLVGARALGHEPDGVLYDVLRKPTMEPAMATPLEARKYTKPSKAEPTPRLYANQREVDETPVEYRDRILSNIAENPDRYFQRGVVVRLEKEEVEAATDTWQIADQIRLAHNSECWPRNVDSCSQYGRLCEYWPVCSGETSIDDATRFEKTNIHPELDGKHHLPLLTASSKRAYRACPRRYFFAYEQGVRPIQKAAALRFGTLIHKGLEVWLTSGYDLDAALAAMRAPVDGRIPPYDYEAAKAEAMLRGYHARWCNDSLEIVAVEKEFVTDLRNPATGAASRTFARAGKLDALIRKAG